ncbi:MAG TPA: EscU/YscU/HrcU family type III secretion system export apparatus switch protein [Kofleriaceae bacterium]|nr:EscU/YscU/HrcU family type III secretion system export apparatus switch protein [Kofleriaceae bacterium]
MERPFPPTPRRRALARSAGVVLDSPAFTAAAAIALGVLAIAAVVPSIAASVRASTAAALAHAADEGAVARATGSTAAGVVASVLDAVGPLVLAAAVGAVAATAAMTRSLFVPRRNVRGAPGVPPEPGVDAALGLARAAVVAAVGATFVVVHVPSLTALATSSSASSVAPSVAPSLASALASLGVHALAHVAVAALLVAATDIVVRHRRLEGALRMTSREAREEARNAGSDPHARRRLRDARGQLAHGVDPRERLRDATLVLVGADVAVALRYTSGMAAPVALRTARGLARQQLVSAARALAIPLIADDDLARALVTGVAGLAPAHQPALARALAAIT